MKGSIVKNKRMLFGGLIAAAVASLGVITAVSAFNNDATNSADKVETINVAPWVGHGKTLHQARLDLAERLGIDPEKINLVSTSYAGWDGCLGIIDPAGICTMQYIVGVVALFEADGETYRYHVTGDEFVATDWRREGTTVADNPITDVSLMPNGPAILAEYARHDLALRLGVDVNKIVVANNLPVTFMDLCLGFSTSEDEICAQALGDGAIVLFLHDGDTYRYHVNHHRIIATDFEEGEVTIEIDEDLAELQLNMRRALALKLNLSLGQVSLASMENVTWPDGCMGVYYKDSLCSQALREGFIAYVADYKGNAYKFHGSGSEFIAVDFLDADEVRIEGPVMPVEPDGGIGDTPDQGIDVGEPAPGTNAGRVMDPETAIRLHLSEARGIHFDDIKVVSFENVTWPDGCRGVYFKDALCTMATVDGWIAILVVDGPDKFEYRYHGVVVDAELAPEGDFFTAVWELDEDEFRLGEPVQDDAN